MVLAHLYHLTYVDGLSLEILSLCFDLQVEDVRLRVRVDQDFKRVGHKVDDLQLHLIALLGAIYHELG